jgi:hypothetical protein
MVCKESHIWTSGAALASIHGLRSVRELQLDRLKDAKP